MDNKIIKLDTVQHKYDLEHCAGCNNLITDEFHEIGLPSPDGSEINHIALCNSCYEEAEKEGIF